MLKLANSKSKLTVDKQKVSLENLGVNIRILKETLNQVLYIVIDVQVEIHE